MILLLSAATPGLLYRLRLAEQLLSLPLMRLSHQLSVIIGLMLIVLSWGISRRIKRAYQWTMGLLGAGILFTFTKAFDYEEAIFLILIAFLLYVSRKRFYRLGAQIGRGTMATWAVSTVIVALLYEAIASGTQPPFFKHLPPGHERYLHLILNPTEHTVAIITGLAVTWILLSLTIILRPNRLGALGATEAERDKLRGFLGETGGNLLTHMLFAGDKSFFGLAADASCFRIRSSATNSWCWAIPLAPRRFFTTGFRNVSALPIYTIWKLCSIRYLPQTCRFTMNTGTDFSNWAKKRWSTWQTLR